MSVDEAAPGPGTVGSLRDSEARWRAVVDSAVDGIIVIDRRGLIEGFNPAAERLFGYHASEVAGQNVSMLMPQSYSVQHDDYLRRYLDSGERRIIGIGREVEGRRKDGSTFPLHLSVGEMSVDGETKFTGIIRDLTERVELEQRLREATALARVGQFAAVVAHEVRNPLAAVSGAIQMLSQRLVMAGEDREIVSDILQRIDGLNALINDLLVYARPPRPVLRPISAVDLVESLIAFLKSDPAWQDLHVTREGELPPVMADPELLKIAVQNLLINAAQASPAAGAIRVRLHRGPGMAHVDVIDGGPGIPDTIRADLFTPFSTTKAKGTGLGLATVRRIADAHHGGVSVVESGPAGTTMRFSLPEGAGPAPAALD